MNITKIKEFCAAKYTVKNMNTQPTEKEKIFASHVSDKELAF